MGSWSVLSNIQALSCDSLYLQPLDSIGKYKNLSKVHGSVWKGAVRVRIHNYWAKSPAEAACVYSQASPSVSDPISR